MIINFFLPVYKWKNNLLKSIFLFLSIFIGISVPVAHAERCNYTTDSSPLDDTLIGISCDESGHGVFENKVRRDFGIEQYDWDEGFGYTVCKADTGYGKTLNAIYLLSKIDDWSWYRRTSYRIDDLDADCENGDSYATHVTLPGIMSFGVNIHLPFYNRGLGGPVKRASTLVHEARHKEKEHDEDHIFEENDCPRGASCDSSWEFDGANAWQVKFLVDVVCSNNPDHSWLITPFLRRMSAEHANYILSNGFKTSPGSVDRFITCQDIDNDYIPDLVDNCPSKANPPSSYAQQQLDTDEDGIGEECDYCRGVRGGKTDSDGDGAGDVCDNCFSAPNPDQRDTDRDAVGNACDNCPTVSNRDQSDTTDQDGVGDECDTDKDNDGISNERDNCPLKANPNQEDPDHDGIGDSCDNCRAVSNNDQIDNDCDGIGDACDDMVLPLSCKPPAAIDKRPEVLQKPDWPVINPTNKIQILDKEKMAPAQR